MQAAVYGSGYLGTVISACLADFGTPVACYDENPSNVAALSEGVVSFYEKNLKDVLKRNLRAGRLSFTSELSTLLEKAQVVFLAEDTYLYIEEVALKIARQAPREAVLVVATPVPVGTASRIEKRLRAAGSRMPVVSQPLFLTDGCAIEDFNWPDRIVLGARSTDAVLLLKQVYRPLVMRGVPVIVTNFETAELVREATTAFVATKISFINELAALCEHVSADAMDLSLALGLDKKISPRCLQPGTGLGGPFVESDMDALVRLASGSATPLRVLEAAREVQRAHCDLLVEKISAAVPSLTGSELGLLGLAFKPNTNCVAASQSILLAKALMARGANLRAYDPVAIPDARLALDGTVRYCETPYAAAEGVDALVVSTGWPEFRALDFDRIKRLLRQPVIVDTKNLLDGSRMRALGFQYVGVGRA